LYTEQFYNFNKSMYTEQFYNFNNSMNTEQFYNFNISMYTEQFYNLKKSMYTEQFYNFNKSMYRYTEQFYYFQKSMYTVNFNFLQVWTVYSFITLTKVWILNNFLKQNCVKFTVLIIFIKVCTFHYLKKIMYPLQFYYFTNHVYCTC